MKLRELARLHVLNNILEYQIPIVQAAEILGISERHTRRLLNAYRKDGAAALAHGNRGRRPHNAIPESQSSEVVKLASSHYAGTNHTHLTELLRDQEGIDLSRPTVRRILVRAGIGSPRRRRPQQHRVRRRRMPQEGMLLQIDGSHHQWLGEKCPRFTLLLTVDDATGTVSGARFSKEEDTRSYLLLMSGLIREHGIPLALYSDRHPVFKFTGDLSEYPAGPTQFARAMEELGIQQIFARSPQAKGRVERAAGTFQDRLVTELRLSGAATIDEANEVLRSFLSRFNQKFGVQAEESTPAYRPLDPSLSLEHVLCFKHSRKVARDNTVKYNTRTLQLLPIAAWYGSPQLRRIAGGNTREPGRPDIRAIFGAGHRHPGGTAASGSAQGSCPSCARKRRGPMGHGSQRPLAREPGNSGNRKCRPAPEDTQIQSETGQTAHPSSEDHMEIRPRG